MYPPARQSRSLLAVRQVLDWASEQGMTIRDRLSAEQLVTLGHVFSGAAAWSFELYQPLRVLSHAVARLDFPDLPARIHFADALAAIEAVMGGEPWPISNGISARAFSELSYAQTSAGITRLKERFPAAWREHAVRNKNFLLQASSAAGGRSALVIGAGKIYDIPLRGLAERFDKLFLFDVDLNAMQHSIESSGLAPELRERLELVQADVTGVNDTFVERARKALAPTAEEDVYAAILELLHSYRLGATLAFAPTAAGRVDVAISSMVLSQLATPLTEYLEACYSARFPGSQRWRRHELQVALGQFTHRVQHAHVRALTNTARLAVLTSDVAEQAGDGWLPLIGAPSLEELSSAIDQRVSSTAEWRWERVPASRQPPGRHLEVQGVVLREATETAL